MGGHAWYYFAPYDDDASRALRELREREFAAGRYNPATPFPFARFDPVPILVVYNLLAPRRRHATIEEALEDSGFDGTRSILDIQRVTDQPEFLSVAPLSEESVKEVYGTTQPTHEMVAREPCFGGLPRGSGLYLTVYKDGKPSELFFSGYSID